MGQDSRTQDQKCRIRWAGLGGSIKQDQRQGAGSCGSGHVQEGRVDRVRIRGARSGGQDQGDRIRGQDPRTGSEDRIRGQDQRA